ncbi:MAG: hypothetical protein KDN20_10215 [Verrucomicrobiae bacterium]|nr:hypothetical protein [Verrucomicrobiae bacterium]
MKPTAPLCLGVFFAMSVQSAWAIPNSFIGNGGFIGPIVPAQPRFGANLTEDFLNLAHWDTGKFSGPWKESGDLRKMTAMPVLFGAVPDSVVLRKENDRVREIIITYLDAATFFPYQAGGEKTRDQRDIGEARRAEFDSQWHRLERELRERLTAGCGPGEQVVEGRSDLLRRTYLDYAWEDFRLRLARHADHSVALHLSRISDPAPAPVDQALVALDATSRSAALAKNITVGDHGETFIEGIPVFDQGFTPYCGVHALAMVAHYHGLRLPPGDLAAGAEFANTGSARGSRILDLYRAVGEELRLTESTSSRFDQGRVERSLRAGLPVIVWRRVSMEREKAHAEFASRLINDPALALEPLSAQTKAQLPPRNRKGSPSHASVITGIDADNDTLIYLEPWEAESAQRRMRAEEMEATTYAVFYFEP